MSRDSRDQAALQTAIRAALSGVIDPRTGKDVLTGDLVAGTSIITTNGTTLVTITLNAPGGASPQNDAIASEIEEALSALQGVDRARVVATAHRPADTARPSPGAGGHTNPLGTAGKKDDAPLIPGVRHVVVVASGKGGVGKSTVAANLAAAFARAGYRTGLCDADIYGPSLPVIFGLSGRAEFADDKIQPMRAHGVKAMSIGFLVSEDKAVAWRGPMVMGAVKQLFSDVNWGDLDILIVDTPPGTGDAHLTLLQKIPVSGAVIVSTPQEMALADVRRGAALFSRMEVPVLGLVENMAWFDLPDGTRQPLFGEGGVSRMAEQLGLDLLASLPLDPALGHSADTGTPYVLSDPEAPAAAEIRSLAKKVAGKLALVPQDGDA